MFTRIELIVLFSGMKIDFTCGINKLTDEELNKLYDRIIERVEWEAEKVYNEGRRK